YDKCKNAAKYVDNYDLSLIPNRPNYSFKGSFGKVLIIAGNEEMSGAAAMSGMAAYRVGAGLVRLFTAQENKEVIGKLLPEAVVNTYDSEEFDVKSLEASIAWADVIAIGPGLGTGDIQNIMVEKVLDSKKPCVVDADAINTIAKNRNLYKKLHAEVILTPHLGEMSRL
ncbi:MAG: NAD(P)H-hydrate dehydratase, partial [Eubacterium sp.]|nr:NAD(P)H-hydrate dehydratase [Eubacterium sp.]